MSEPLDKDLKKKLYYVEYVEQYKKEARMFLNILIELEQWLEMMEEKETIGTYSMVQDKIQELKEKYK